MKWILSICLFITLHSNAQIANGGFEGWDTTFNACYYTDLVTDYAVTDPFGGNPNGWDATMGFLCGNAQTTDSYSGNYSLLLYNWYNYAYGQINYFDSLNYRPQFIQGIYKYITGGAQGLSHGYLNVALTRYNGTSNDTIATGVFQFDSAVTYIPFQVNLAYTSLLNPDSVKIFIVNSENHCGSHLVCNLLYLDDLNFSNIALNTNDLRNPEKIKFSPNPFSNTISFQNPFENPVIFRMYNSFGQMVYETSMVDQAGTLEIPSVSDGIYFYKVFNETILIETGKLIKQ